MNDNENKTNAPTIKLPVMYANGYIFDADGQKIAFCDVGIKTLDAINARGEQIAVALNEADALRAEVEGLRTAIIGAIRETCDIRQAIRDGKTDNLVVIENSFYVIQDNLGMALAAIKPNAAAGEEGTE